MDCVFCKINHGEKVPAKHLAPQLDARLPEHVEYVAVCEVHVTDWWDGSDVAPLERPCILDLPVDERVLARAVLDWAKSGEPKGGNPYCKPFVKLAQRILGEE